MFGATMGAPGHISTDGEHVSEHTRLVVSTIDPGGREPTPARASQLTRPRRQHAAGMHLTFSTRGRGRPN